MAPSNDLQKKIDDTNELLSLMSNIMINPSGASAQMKILTDRLAIIDMNRGSPATQVTDDAASAIHALTKRMADIVVDPTTAQMTELMHDMQTYTLASPLTHTEADIQEQLNHEHTDHKNHLYRLHLAHLPEDFTPATIFELMHQNLRATLVMARYTTWLEADHVDLVMEEIPRDAQDLAILSRAMACEIVRRAREGDERSPPSSPADHPCSPFWLEKGKYEG